MPLLQLEGTARKKGAYKVHSAHLSLLALADSDIISAIFSHHSARIGNTSLGEGRESSPWLALLATTYPIARCKGKPRL